MNGSNYLEIPGHLTLAGGNGGLAKAVVETRWSSAEIYLYGAQVTGFQKKGEAPLLFMSGSSKFQSGTPIRAGVPVIFPWFGPREGLPAHGFARTSTWDLVETSLLDDGKVRLCFSLQSIDFYHVQHIVTVGETLSLELVVTNRADSDAIFETCLHTYFQVSAIDQISITGLANTGYIDKGRDVGPLETSPSIRIADEVDRVYYDTAAAVEIEDPGYRRTIRVEKSGSLSTVVWNPWIETSRHMADLGDDEYLQMVCVESGNVGKNKITLPPGETAVLKVELSSQPHG